MTPIRLIALDIDGTLLDSHQQVPEANRAAIAEAVARGVEVALVTGRRYNFALPIAEKIPAPLTMILNNGAIVKSKDGTTHLRHLLPKDVALSVLRAMSAFHEGAAVQFDRAGKGQIVYAHIDWDDPVRKAYLLRNRHYLAEISPLENCLTEDPIQVMFTGKMDRMRAVAELLDSLPFAGQFSVARTFYESRNFAFVDVIRAGCSKGATLAEWASLRGIAREEIMAVGDNLNDREMLEYAGMPVVMGNSVPELKSFGWRETLTNDEAGVAHAISEYALSPTAAHARQS
jgi:Cof subfamily protein (haloacid dehalogenase superfamily)